MGYLELTEDLSQRLPVNCLFNVLFYFVNCVTCAAFNAGFRPWVAKLSFSSYFLLFYHIRILLFFFLLFYVQIYLNTFDVVIIGDGNLQYVRSMIEDILLLPHTASRGM